MKLILHLFTVLFLLSGTLSYAQDNTLSKEIIVENNIKYYKHKVKDRESLQILSKRYKTTEDAIHKANGGFLTTLSPGEIIKIPAVYFPVGETKQKFREHKTNRKETLYAISRIYHITVDDIIKYNPQLLEKELKVKQILKIPDNGQEPMSQIYVSEDDHYIYFKTKKKGLSLYAIAKEYNIEHEKLHMANPNLAATLKKGQKIRIPKKIEIAELAKEEIKKEEEEIKNSKNHPVTGDPLFFVNPQNKVERINYDENPIVFKITVLLPLFLDENEQIGFGVSEKNDIKYHSLSRKVIEFYTGLLMAVDTLRSDGALINLQVYDTKADTNIVNTILQTDHIKESHLIIGPLYANPFRLAEKFSHLNKINIVSPNYYTNDIEAPDLTATNPYFFQTEPSINTRIKTIAQNISTSNAKNIILLSNIKEKEEDEYTPNEKKELKLISAYKDFLFDAFSKHNTFDKVNYTEINFSKSKIRGVVKLLKDSVENIIIVPSNDKNFVINLIPQLNIQTKEKHLTLYGTPEWEQFDNLELEHLHNLKLHTCSSTYLDFSDQEIIDFTKKYRATFHGEPSSLTFKGYDILWYFINTMKEYGTDIQPYMSSPQNTLKRGLSSVFDFKRTSDFGGLENSKLFVIKYNPDFSITREK